MTVLPISVVAVWDNYFLPLLIFNVNTRYPARLYFFDPDTGQAITG